MMVVGIGMVGDHWGIRAVAGDDYDVGSTPFRADFLADTGSVLDDWRCSWQILVDSVQ